MAPDVSQYLLPPRCPSGRPEESHTEEQIASNFEQKYAVRENMPLNKVPDKRTFTVHTRPGVTENGERKMRAMFRQTECRTYISVLQTLQNGERYFSVKWWLYINEVVICKNMLKCITQVLSLSLSLSHTHTQS
jgi:hypothetical protein